MLCVHLFDACRVRTCSDDSIRVLLTGTRYEVLVPQADNLHGRHSLALHIASPYGSQRLLEANFTL